LRELRKTREVTTTALGILQIGALFSILIASIHIQDGLAFVHGIDFTGDHTPGLDSG
jgi:hypothetical protein